MTRNCCRATGCGFLAGLVSHARAAAAFTTPTINGYKRYRSYSLAPDRAIWARDNRGVMIRVLGGPGDPATRLENRVGEPAANPYLYMASQIVTGLDGMERMLDPGPSADTPYEAPGAAVAEDPRGGARRVARPTPASPKASARISSTIICASRRPRSRATTPRSRNGSSGNISSCFRRPAARRGSSAAKCAVLEVSDMGIARGEISGFATLSRPRRNHPLFAPMFSAPPRMRLPGAGRSRS